MKQRLLALPVLLLAMTLASCVPVLFGGATASGLVVASNRTAGAFIEDQRIEFKAFNDLLTEIDTEWVRFNVVSINRVVLLVGQVPDEGMREEVLAVLGRIQNVRQIIDKMTVGPTNSLENQVSDTLVTTKVKSEFIQVQEGDFSSLDFKVLTEDGVVYLMGLVTRDNAAKAVELARQVDGARQVVKVFEYVPDVDSQS